jgi:hypothetical protein
MVGVRVRVDLIGEWDWLDTDGPVQTFVAANLATRPGQGNQHLGFV